jgi:hypothetical protein
MECFKLRKVINFYVGEAFVHDLSQIGIIGKGQGGM